MHIFWHTYCVWQDFGGDLYIRYFKNERRASAEGRALTGDPKHEVLPNGDAVSSATAMWAVCLHARNKTQAFKVVGEYLESLCH